MSQLGKILLYLALVGALAAAGAGGYIIYQRGLDAATLAQTQQDKAAAIKSAGQAKQEATEAAQKESDAESKLTAANSKIEDLNTQLTTAQKAAADAAQGLQTATDATKAAQDALDKIKATLNGKSPDEIVAAEAKAESDLQASQSEQKILQDQLVDSQKKVADAQDEINRSKTGTIPPGVSGKITWVNRTWNFVVLDVGLSNGVVPNGELIVYRGKDFLGKVKITSAEANSSVADILPDVKGDIQVGDYVLN